MADILKTDLRLVFRPEGDADLAGGVLDLETVSDADNLAQALTLRLLVHRGELAGLGHPGYGSRIHDLIGEPLDRPNLDLLRRYVRKALLGDPRVAEVTRVEVAPRPDAPGTVAVEASVKAISGASVNVEVELDAG
jgi:phage baseplate assembly protein W